MAKLFVILTVLCVFGAVLAKTIDKKAAMEKFMNKVNVCKTEVGAKDDDVRELVNRKSASTMEGKCLRSCLLKKLKLMDANGKFDKEAALYHAEKYTGGDANKMATAIVIISSCSDITVSDNECEAGEEYAICFKNQATAHGLIK